MCRWGFKKKRLSLWVRRKWSGVGGGSAVVLPYAPWIACKWAKRGGRSSLWMAILFFLPVAVCAPVFPQISKQIQDARWLKGMKWFSVFRPEDADIWPIWLFDLWPQLPAEQTGGFPLRSLGLMSFPSARFKISLINTAHRSVTTGIKVTDGGDRGGGRGGEEGYRHLALIPPLLLLLKLRCSVWSTINQRISECDLLSCSLWGVTYEQFEALQITDCRDCGSVLRCAHRWWRSSSSSQWIRPSRGDNRLVVSDINSGEKWVSGSQVRVQKSVWACARNRFT